MQDERTLLCFVPVKMTGTVALFFVLFVFFLVLKAKVGKSVGDWPYYAKKPLSVPEQVLYWRLNEALPEHIVLAQVALSQLLGVKKGNQYYVWYNQISQLVADFVICTKDSTVVAVIELDDSSHGAPRRQRADAKKGGALAAAGIKVIRWNVKDLPNGQRIRDSVIGRAIPAPAPKGRIAPTLT